MPHIFKHVYSRKIPTVCERYSVKGKEFVRWKGRGGRWVVAAICTTDPSRCLVECSKWYVAYTDHSGKPKKVPGFTDKAATQELMQKLTRQSERIESGLLPPEAAQPKLTLTDLLSKWEKYIRANGASEDGARRQYQRARDVCDGVGASRVSDLKPTAVMDWIGERRKEDRHRKRFGETTAANYLGSIKSFTLWCARVQKCEPTDHLSAIKRPSTRTELRVERRALSADEFRAFLEAVQKSRAKVYGLSAAERHALYLVASSTGLRASELASLTPASFDFTRSTITIPGRVIGNKSRKTATLPVAPLVLGAVKRIAPKTGAIWPNRGKPSQAWWVLGARMIRDDLAAAGIPCELDGKVYDFHSLRGQFATDLDRAGVSLVKAQKLMRHSSPMLTAKHYTRADADELAGAVAKLKRGMRG